MWHNLVPKSENKKGKEKGMMRIIDDKKMITEVSFHFSHPDLCCGERLELFYYIKALPSISDSVNTF